MQASEGKFTKFISGEITFVIPVYQRNYDWRKTDCQQLFNDITNVIVSKKPHFIGTFVYTYDPAVGTAQEYIIIDGQQRITSIILFAKALYDLSDDEELKAEIRSKFIKHTTGRGLKNKCRLRPTEYDCATFEKLMSDDFDESNLSDAEKSSAMYINYRLFREKISASTLSKEDLCDAIGQLNIVEIMLKEENPQEIFESLNSTGLALTKADLIRNFLLMPLPYDAQDEFYKKYWLEIENQLHSSDKVENFLLQYLIAVLKTNSTYAMKVKPDNLYIVFKKFFEQQCCSDTESCLKNMFRYSKYFCRLLFNDDTKFENLSTLNKKFYELTFLLKAGNAPIILMYLLDRNEREPFDEETFVKFVDALVSLTFRAKICGRSGITSQFAGNVLARLDKEPFLDANKFWRVLLDSSKVTFPSDEAFQTALVSKNLYETIKSDGCRYMLYKLERAARAKELPAYASATVEHILPQKLSRSWKNYLSEKNDSQNYELWLHTLGNLTLTGYNSELSNDDFDAKKTIYAQSGFHYTRTLCNYSEWTSGQIQMRAKKLAGAAIKVWILPEEFNSRFANLGNTFNLDSDFGALKGTKPARFWILDMETKVSSWIDFTREIVKKLYELDENIFRQATQSENFPRKNKLFSAEPQTQQKPFKIAENYYMENRLSTEECLKIAKILVENFDRLGDTNFKEEIYFTLRK